VSGSDDTASGGGVKHHWGTHHRHWHF
jgi:hypothetical protein